MAKRSREQIIRSLRQPRQDAPPAQAKAALARQVRVAGASARDRVGVSAAQAYRSRRLHASAQPLSIGAAGAIAAAGALVAVGVDLYLIAVAVPVACVVAYGAASAAVGSVARRQARDEIELAGAFDRLLESAARELSDAHMEKLGRLKG